MTSNPAPLSHIREAELAAAREVAAENERAQRDIAAARSRATSLEAEARATGRARADDRFDSAIEEARERAAAIEQAQGEHSRHLRATIQPKLDGLAAAMLEIILPRTE